MIKFSPITTKRFNKFKKNKMAYYSTIIILSTYILSLFAPILINDIPLFIKYEGKSYFPILSFYPDSEFGGKEQTEPSYKLLAKSEKFKNSDNFIIFPIIPYGKMKVI